MATPKKPVAAKPPVKRKVTARKRPLDDRGNMVKQATLTLMKAIEGQAYHQSYQGLLDFYKPIRHIVKFRHDESGLKYERDRRRSVSRVILIDLKSGDQIYARVRTIPHTVLHVTQQTPAAFQDNPLYATAVKEGKLEEDGLEKFDVLYVDEVSFFSRDLILRAQYNQSLILSSENLIRNQKYAKNRRNIVHTVEGFEEAFCELVGMKGLGTRNIPYQNRKIKGKVAPTK